MEDYEDYEDFEPESFRERLESTAEPTMKVLAYIIFVAVLIIGEIEIYDACAPHYGYYHDTPFQTGRFIAMSIGCLTISYLIWATIIASVNMLNNIKRCRKLLEKIAKKN